MHPQTTVDLARLLSQQGVIDREVAQITGVSIAAVRKWRKIELADWQQVIVARYPGEFARGLFHSDGYRGVNRVCRRWGGAEHWYRYPRYLFVNNSADILRLCGQTLDRPGVEWRFSKPNTISVARKEAVAKLDEFVGAKY